MPSDASGCATYFCAEFVNHHAHDVDQFANGYVGEYAAGLVQYFAGWCGNADLCCPACRPVARRAEYLRLAVVVHGAVSYAAGHGEVLLLVRPASSVIFFATRSFSESICCVFIGAIGSGIQ